MLKWAKQNLFRRNYTQKNLSVTNSFLFLNGVLEEDGIVSILYQLYMPMNDYDRFNRTSIDCDEEDGRVRRIYPNLSH